VQPEAPKIIESGMAMAPEFINDPHAIDKLYAALQARAFVMDYVLLGPAYLRVEESSLFTDLLYVKLSCPYIEADRWDILHFSEPVR
jgi:hypothetical protein